MKIQRFEDIFSWQISRELVGAIYRVMQSNRDYSFRDQMQRASLSIMNNIAEGFERRGDKEFVYFLKIAKGSCAEVRSMLYAGKDLGYLSAEDFEKLFTLNIRIGQTLLLFIQSISDVKDD